MDRLFATSRGSEPANFPRSSSTVRGLKLRGAGEWLFEKHGTTKRRAWRNSYSGIDAGNGEIVAFDLTDKDVDDASHVPTLLDRLTTRIPFLHGRWSLRQDCNI